MVSLVSETRRYEKADLPGVRLREAGDRTQVAGDSDRAEGGILITSKSL